MDSKRLAGVILLLSLCQVGLKSSERVWILEKHTRYNLFFTTADIPYKEEYVTMIENGLRSVSIFFNGSYEKTFDVYVHPNRHSLDSTWQKDWNMPDFKSECWMVASGVATKLDVISPRQWEKEVCEHTYSEKTKAQNLITHELIHVFHGQKNVSHDFSDVQGLDWFVEGLATYASGQCDADRLSEVRKAIANNTIPGTLDKFWSGKMKYGLSGSVVMFIDSKYGRNKLLELLPVSKKAEVLSTLNTTESALLAEWKSYIHKL